MKQKKATWDDVLLRIQEELNDKHAFEAWFKPLEPVSFKSDKVRMRVPDEYFLKWFKRNYADILERTLAEFYGHSIKVEYEWKDTGVVPSPNTAKVPVRNGRLFGLLDLRFTFDTFVVGKSNEFAYAAANAVAESPGTRYNPLFIYGGVGLGKTHLLNAIGNKIISSRTNLRVCSITTDQFMNDFVRASVTNKILEFQNFYRNSFDVLLVDDIHYLEGKPGTQDQFFHIFNIFFNARKQIVLTSDKYPQNLSEVEERLKNRFEQGLIVDIKPPEYETKVAIIRKKALLENFYLNEELAHYIVQQVNADNVRKLEGALVRVLAYASMKGGDITKELVDEALSGFISQRRKLTEDDVINTVARHFNIRANEIKSKKRTKHIAFPRQIAMYLCREVLHSSFPDIGHRFGGKDHSTVIHSVNKIKELVKNDPDIRELIENLTKKLKG